ncbi:MAG TPA: peroxiredoxin [Sphingomonas sp.]
MRLPLRFLPLALAAIAVPAAAALPTGAKAPDFRTRGAVAGTIFRLHLAEQIKKGPVVLYFFPAAYTGGCNQEAHDFAENIDKFKAAGATVIGVSMDTVPVLVKFSSEKCAGKFPVVSAGPRVVAAYDVALGRQIKDPQTGKMRDATNRTSYVIDRTGKIVFALSDPSPEGHISGTLEAVRKLN